MTTLPPLSQTNTDDHEAAASQPEPNGEEGNLEEDETTGLFLWMKSSSPTPTSKSDLYSMEELETILNLHQKLSTNQVFEDESSSAESVSAASFPNLHDLIQQAVQQADATQEEEEKKELAMESPSMDETNDRSVVDVPLEILKKYQSRIQGNDDLIQRIAKIRAIASDVDGTLLTTTSTVHPLTRAAVQTAVGVSSRAADKDNKDKDNKNSTLDYFFPATGKTREGALTSLGTELSNLLSTVPGVYNQGLYCVNAQGHVVFEQKLINAPDLLDAAQAVIEQEGLTILAYDGDVLYTTPVCATQNPHHLELVHTIWGEPRPVLLNTGRLRDYTPGFHKVLVMADTADEIVAFRPTFQAVAEPYHASVTSAVPRLVELLPPNSSKAVGVQELCRVLGIDMATELLAIGDGENDLQLLQQASIGIAMGNAVDLVKQAEGVDLVLDETNNQGGAGIAIALFGLGQVLQQQPGPDR